MARTRSRARAGAPAARAARAVNGPGRDERRDRGISTSMKLGQAVVFGAALALLALYTVSDQLARDEGFHVRIGWVSLALLGVAAFVVVLPRVTRVHAAPDGVGVDLAGRAHDAALTAATVALGRGAAERDMRALLAGEPSPALARAAIDPLASVELSRRALAAELRRIAAVAGVPVAASSLVDFADRLFRARWLSGPEAGAIGEVAAVIDAAKASGSVTAAVAQDVDDAVQLLVPLLDGRLDDATARFDRRAPEPGPYDELDAVDHLDEADELEPVEDAPAADTPAVDTEDGDDFEIDLRERPAPTAEPADPGAPAAPEPRAIESPPPEPVAWRSSP